MKLIIFGLILATCNAWAETSKLAPIFQEATRIYVEGSINKTLILRPELRAALDVLDSSQIDPVLLQERVLAKNSDIELREDDEFDSWANAPKETSEEAPEMAIHASQFKVVEESDDWMKDDIYVYFFVTDGVIPTGKVSSVYRGLGRNQSFFFNEIDRAIFPLPGIPAKRPDNHIIVDYGIMESDGEDIRKLQKLSSIIIDLAIAVYSSYDPQNAEIIINLRKEIKALTEMILSLNTDDRLATGSFGYKARELNEMLKDDSYVEIMKKHRETTAFSSWEYRIFFRLLRK